MSTFNIWINGEKNSINTADLDPSMTLLQYLRNIKKLTGTKLSCGEAGCGACTVDIAKWATGATHMSVNACLRPLATLNGYSVTTVEGLGATATKCHPVQERLVAFNGTQCGYCTPGMVMGIYSSLKSTNNNIDMQSMESQLDGNICRCTGYRPILDAAKSFCKDSNVTANVVKEGADCPYDPATHDPQFPDEAKSYTATTIRTNTKDGVEWIIPTSLAEALEVASHGTVRLIGGNTMTGIYKSENFGPTCVFIGQLRELQQVQVTETGVKFGGAVTLTEVLNTLQANTAKSPSFGPLAEHISKIANTHVRNSGTIAGNLVMAKTKGFLSDLATILSAAKAEVKLLKANADRTQSVFDFISTTEFNGVELLESVFIPFLPSTTHFHTYRTAVRHLNAHAFINAAFNLSMDGDKVKEAVIVYGGVAADAVGGHAVRAVKTEGAIKGKTLTNETLQGTLQSIADEIRPDSSLRHVEYRKRLITAFWYKFFAAIVPSTSTENKSAAVSYPKARVTKAAQSFPASNSNTPLGKALPKYEGKWQATGEALYMDDGKDYEGTLHGAWVTATVARAKIVSVDTSAALAVEGVFGYVDNTDVKGVNNAGPMAEAIPVFAAEKTLYFGQPLGMVLAENKSIAQQAAKLVKVQYDQGTETPVLTIDDALKTPDMILPLGVKDTKVGEDAQALLSTAAKKVSGTFEIASQKHFYMETQACYCVPDEAGRLTVYTPHQWGEGIVKVICRVTGLPSHSVRVTFRRAGGAFGGKFFAPGFLSSACAIAAQKYKRPVRLTLDRNTDMAFVGGREGIKCTYDCAYDEKTAAIQALSVELVGNCGSAMDMALFLPMIYQETIQQAYNIPSLLYNFKPVKTNTASRGPVRGPAEPGGSLVIETILENIAQAMGKDANEVREANLLKVEEGVEVKSTGGHAIFNYTIPQLWQTAKDKSAFEKRSQAVKEFNDNNRWRKRGLAITPVKYHVQVARKASLVNVYHDGCIVLHHTCNEMGQGLNTKAVQAALTVLQEGLDITGDIAYDLCRVADPDVHIVPNGYFTGGSVSSEGTVLAVQRACGILVDRLKPIVEKWKAAQAEQNKDKADFKAENPTWPTLTSFAADKADLSAQYCTLQDPSIDPFPYHNYGAAVNEVEVDVLTGEVETLYTEIVYDSGKSLNPNVDIGQGEGAFVMGIGHMLHEEEDIYDAKTGELHAVGTWEYKPPMARDIPHEFNITLIENNDFKKGVAGSKSIGEPPLVLSTGIAMAVRHALRDAREQMGVKEFLSMKAPFLPPVVAGAVDIPISKMTL